MGKLTKKVEKEREALRMERVREIEEYLQVYSADDILDYMVNMKPVTLLATLERIDSEANDG